MAEEILPNLYRIEIPLPKNPLKSVNSYVIKSHDRFLVIDTGMNQEACMHEMLSNLQKLGVDLKKTDFFITHMHVDHIGLVPKLATNASKIYFNQKEASMLDWLYSEQRWEKVYQICQSHGFTEGVLKKSIERHPGRQYGPKCHLDFCMLKEGDILQNGDYSFRCIETPGHTPGHMCLYESDKKILISGDHILIDITPNITPWLEMENSLREYLASLDKVYDLDVNLVLPGHRRIWNDHKGRIKELRNHHQARLMEILSALGEGGRTAFEIAPNLSWDINYKSWNCFPSSQKFFAVEETIAHLEYLEKGGVLQSKIKEGKLIFSLMATN